MTSMSNLSNVIKKIVSLFLNFIEPSDAEAFDFEHCRKIDALGKNGCADPSCDSNFIEIRNSFKTAMSTLYSSSCLPGDMRNTVDVALNNLEVIPITCKSTKDCAYNPPKDPLCAYRDPDEKSIDVCPRTFTYNPAEGRDCTEKGQCLKSTFFHETLHFGIHSHIRVGPCTRKCFSDCARTSASCQAIDPSCCTDKNSIAPCCFANNWVCGARAKCGKDDPPQPNPCLSVGNDICVLGCSKPDWKDDDGNSLTW